MAQLIEVNNTATNFSDGEITVAAGAVITLMIKGSTDGDIPAGVIFQLARKGSGGNYIHMKELNASNIVKHGVLVGGSASTTYAVRRLATSNSAGMDYT